MIEIVMTLVVVAIVVAGLSFYIKNIVDLYSFVTFRNDIASTARVGLSRMVREIRQSASPTQGAITVASSNSFTFTDITGASIAYSLSGNNLMRNSEVLAHHISSLTFTYYDLNHLVLGNLPLSASDCQNVVRVVIQIQVSYGGQNLTMKSQTFLRNY